MNIHEYQARDIFRSHGLPVPPGEVASDPDAAREIAARFGGAVVVKAQVHAGGRGKAGGVKLADGPAEARDAAEAILGMEIKGHTVRRVLVAPAVDIESEAYLGVAMDRGRGCDVVIASSEGGIDIEEVAATRPEAIHRERVDPRYGLLAHQAARIAYALYDDPGLARRASGIVEDLYRAYRDSGATLAEVNPLVVTAGGELQAIDAKMNIDDNALHRLPEIAALRDEEAEAPSERRAREAGLSYVKLEGNVGCCVNGAGLAMATMDLIKYYGGDPANFLDIGGSSSPDKVVAALEIIADDSNVRSVLFNIFGGITRCDDVANGIVEATGRIELDLPITIRLTGTNEEEAVAILEENGFQAMVDMDEAVRTAVERAGAWSGRPGRAPAPGGDREAARSTNGKDMSVFIDEGTRLVVQGITGRDGSFHARQMIEYGTRVVAGVTPGKGGQRFDDAVPVFDTVREAVRETEADTSVIYVPARFAADAIFEAADSGIDLIVCITEGIPVADMMRVLPYVEEKGARLIGPNCPGLIVPGVAKVGILPGQIVEPGPVGIVSRSGTLTYEVVFQLTRAGIGQSTCVGIGGDPLIGTDFVDCLEAFEADSQTEAVVLIGEIGGTDEQVAAEYAEAHMRTPVVGFVAGQTAPPGRRMGHAGAIISGSEGTAEEKMRAFRAHGVPVAERPVDIVGLVGDAL